MRAAAAGIAGQVAPVREKVERHDLDLYGDGSDGTPGIKAKVADQERRLTALEKRLDTWFSVALAHMLIVWTAVVGFLGWIVQSVLTSGKGDGQ